MLEDLNLISGWILICLGIGVGMVLAGIFGRREEAPIVKGCNECAFLRAMSERD